MRLHDRRRRTTLGGVNLHDWIDELCDALDIETEVDEALVLDLARDAAHNVERPAAPDHDVPARLRRRAPRRRPRAARGARRPRPPRWPRSGTASDPTTPSPTDVDDDGDDDDELVEVD